MKRTLLATAVVAGMFITAPVSAEIKGDEEAVELANRLVEGIGGKELWSKIRTLHVFEKTRTPTSGDGIIGEFWRDLDEPKERYTLRTRTGNTLEFWFDERGAYQFYNGERTDLPEDYHDEVLSYWPGEIYVMYHRLASEDPTLRLEYDGGNSFTAYTDETNQRLGTFWVNPDGDLYRWRHDDGTEYIYGPHKQFGEISFPIWGTQVDGSWMFHYMDVRWSEEAPPVSYDPPADE